MAPQIALRHSLPPLSHRHRQSPARSLLTSVLPSTPKSTVSKPLSPPSTISTSIHSPTTIPTADILVLAANILTLPASRPGLAIKDEPETLERATKSFLERLGWLEQGVTVDTVWKIWKENQGTGSTTPITPSSIAKPTSPPRTPIISPPPQPLPHVSPLPSHHYRFPPPPPLDLRSLTPQHSCSHGDPSHHEEPARSPSGTAPPLSQLDRINRRAEKQPVRGNLGIGLDASMINADRGSGGGIMGLMGNEGVGGGGMEVEVQAGALSPSHHSDSDSATLFALPTPISPSQTAPPLASTDIIEIPSDSESEKPFPSPSPQGSQGKRKRAPTLGDPNRTWKVRQYAAIVEGIVSASVGAGACWKAIERDVAVHSPVGVTRSIEVIKKTFKVTEVPRFRNLLENNTLLTLSSLPAGPGPRGWTQGERQALWRGLVREGEKRCDWDAITAEVGRRGVERTLEQVKKTWTETLRPRYR